MKVFTLPPWSASIVMPLTAAAMRMPDTANSRPRMHNRRFIASTSWPMK